MPPASAPPPTDSLSLVQLRRIVAEFQKPEPIAYDFQYEDLGPVEEEIDEWFVYQFWQWVRLNAAQAAFEAHWDDLYGSTTWEEADQTQRAQLVRGCFDALEADDFPERMDAIRSLLYLVLGRWADTASTNGKPVSDRSAASPTQLEAIQSSIELVTSMGGLGIVWQALQKAFRVFWAEEAPTVPSSNLQDAHDEVLNLMTIMYIAVQKALSDPEGMATTRKELRTVPLISVVFTS